MDGSGNIYLVDEGNHRLEVFTQGAVARIKKLTVPSGDGGFDFTSVGFPISVCQIEDSFMMDDFEERACGVGNTNYTISEMIPAVNSLDIDCSNSSGVAPSFSSNPPTNLTGTATVSFTIDAASDLLECTSQAS